MVCQASSCRVLLAALTFASIHGSCWALLHAIANAGQYQASIWKLHASNGNKPSNEVTIRLNKVLKATHSRRQADQVIQEGRVTVNGQVSTGCMVVPFQDVIHLDGQLVTGWEELNAVATPSLPSTEFTSQTTETSATTTKNFEYIKYWKPRGIICTTDRRISDNILDVMETESNFDSHHRVYPVGRLDKDSTGLILLTSDGRLPNAALRLRQRQSKTYRVQLHHRDAPLDDDELQHLRDGIVITTVAQRDGTAKPLTAPTKPCRVERLPQLRWYQITLQEGRNRQIRKMMAALGRTVTYLHRVQFGKVHLRGLEQPGDWERLEGAELDYIEDLLERYNEKSSSIQQEGTAK